MDINLLIAALIIIGANLISAIIVAWLQSYKKKRTLKKIVKEIKPIFENLFTSTIKEDETEVDISDMLKDFARFNNKNFKD